MYNNDGGGGGDSVYLQQQNTNEPWMRPRFQTEQYINTDTIWHIKKSTNKTLLKTTQWRSFLFSVVCVMERNYGQCTFLFNRQRRRCVYILLFVYVLRRAKNVRYRYVMRFSVAYQTFVNGKEHYLLDNIDTNMSIHLKDGNLNILHIFLIQELSIFKIIFI